MEKKLKCKDEIIIRLKEHSSSVWTYGIFSHYEESCFYPPRTYAVLVGGSSNNINDYEILPYKGNEHLVGTTDSPEEEIKLEREEVVFVTNDPEYDHFEGWVLRNFEIDCDFEDCKIVRYKDFDPYDMKETLKKALVVKNRKIIRYKG